ncbi:MAG: ThiF family adenylyltransferase [Acidobacteria bacterium]|nr:ThiF family adenylyltransferase [Acidobacteriota bacterium]
MLATLNKPKNLELFSRIMPIVGDGLINKQVAIVGDWQDSLSILLEYLVCSAITQFSYFPLSQNSQPLFLESIGIISKRLGLEKQTQAITSQENIKNLDLIIGTGSYQAYELTKKLVKESGKEGIFYFLMTNGSGLIAFLSKGSIIDLPKGLFSLENSKVFNELHLVNVVANYAKGLLLKGTSHARLDIEKVVEANELLIVGHRSWPWLVKPMKLEELLGFTSSFSTTQEAKKTITPTLEGKTCLIVGLGSLGSVIAKTLAQLGANLVLIDGEGIDLANPIRQIYSVDQIGQTKASACATCVKESFRKEKNISQEIFSYQLAISLEDESVLELESLLTEHKVDIAIVATGTGNDRVISQALVGKEVPHIVVSCYARARFFEAIVVDSRGGPCFGCVRGHLYLGEMPSLTPEQKARYISSEHDLKAEPATRIETGRAADLASHLAYGLLNLDENLWLKRALSDEQTFFLGGNASEMQFNGNWAYTIEFPGEVKLFGLQDIVGRGDYVECWDCGRKLPISIHYQI